MQRDGQVTLYVGWPSKNVQNSNDHCLETKERISVPFRNFVRNIFAFSVHYRIIAYYEIPVVITDQLLLRQRLQYLNTLYSLNRFLRKKNSEMMCLTFCSFFYLVVSSKDSFVFRTWCAPPPKRK